MLLIGDLSQATGLSREALRFYEQAGLIQSARLANGYRSFVPETVEIVHYIRTAQQLGFSLAEISHKLPQLSGGEDIGAEQRTQLLNEFLRTKLDEIDVRIGNLQTLREALANRIGLDCPMHAGSEVAA